MSNERASIGIDGNCGYALLGDNIQEGEAEFVEVPNPGGRIEQMIAAKAALARLRERLGMPRLSYFLAPSHPNYMP